MRRLVIGCVLALLAVPALADSKRKAAPDKFVRAAGDVFAKAAKAHDRGDLHAAAKLYAASLELAPHANTVFNLAAVSAALGELYDAVAHYEMYLALAPDAPDRAQVRALITELSARRGTLWIHTPARETTVLDLTEAYILVDGAIVATPGTLKSAVTGIKVPILHGQHEIDSISSVSYDVEDVELRYGQSAEVKTYESAAHDGNVIVRSPYAVRVHLEDKPFQEYKDRRKVAPGKHWVRVFDRTYECPPIEIEAPKGDSVLYLRVTPAEVAKPPTQTPARCRTMTVVKRVLAF